MSRAVVLAAGRGTRMQAAVSGAELDAPQAAMASAGLKGLIPFHGHPYLSYVLSALADAGCSEVCLVVGPGPNLVRERYEGERTQRLGLHFAVQESPRGSADALLAAEPFAAGEPFLVINADNYYPPSVVRPVMEMEGPGMAGFRREALTARGNIPPERVAAYALVRADEQGFIEEIVEKPSPEEAARLEGSAWISMTLWKFDPSIFDACRMVAPSARGELELPQAVGDLVRGGGRLRVVPVADGVLDLSSRADVASVAEKLRGVEVRL